MCVCVFLPHAFLHEGLNADPADLTPVMRCEAEGVHHLDGAQTIIQCLLHTPRMLIHRRSVYSFEKAGLRRASRPLLQCVCDWTRPRLPCPLRIYLTSQRLFR